MVVFPVLFLLPLPFVPTSTFIAVFTAILAASNMKCYAFHALVAKVAVVCNARALIIWRRFPMGEETRPIVFLFDAAFARCSFFPEHLIRLKIPYVHLV